MATGTSSEAGRGPPRRPHDKGNAKHIDRMNPAASAIMKGRTRVQNKSVAGVQVTAEQLILESFDLHRKQADGRPDLIITSKAELLAHYASKRQDFEGLLRKDQSLLASWLKYARWEAQVVQDPARARNIFERAAERLSGNKELWKAYIEFEMAQGAVTHARNVCERAVAATTHAEDVWLLAVLVERVVGSAETTRDLFNRWMRFRPDAPAWRAFARFELDQPAATDSDLETKRGRTRAVLSRFAETFNEELTWVFYADCELDLQDPLRAVEVLNTALVALPSAWSRCPLIIIGLARALEEANDIAQARAVFAKALEAVSADTGITQLSANHQRLQREAQEFELIYGDADQVKATVFDARRLYYRDEIARDPSNTDAWRNLINLERADGASTDHVAALYEQACFAWLPTGALAKESLAWKPLVRVWLDAMRFVEEQAGNPDAAVQIAKRGLAALSSSSSGSGGSQNAVSFPSVWIALAELYQRHGASADDVRAVFEAALKCDPAFEIFQAAIAFELRGGASGNSQARALYERMTRSQLGAKAEPWIAFATFEENVNAGRSDIVFDAALGAESNLMERDAVWIAAVQFCLRRNDVEGARGRYLSIVRSARQLAVEHAGNAVNSEPVVITAAIKKLRSAHSLYVKFELTHGGDALAAAAARVRAEFAASFEALSVNVNARTPLVADWKEFEARHGTTASLKAVDDKLQAPTRKRRDLFAAAKKFAAST